MRRYVVLATVFVLLLLCTETRGQQSTAKYETILPEINCALSNVNITHGAQGGQFVPKVVTVGGLSCNLQNADRKQIPIIGTHDLTPTPDGGAEVMLLTKEFGDLRLSLSDSGLKGLAMTPDSKQKLLAFLKE